jgi:hypothetical protein
MMAGEMTSRHGPLPFDLPPNGGVQAAEEVCLERKIVLLHTSRHDNIPYNVAHFFIRSPASGDTMLLNNIRSRIISVKAGFADVSNTYQKVGVKNRVDFITFVQNARTNIQNARANRQTPSSLPSGRNL